MTHIDQYAFGCVTVDGRQFTSDIVIYPDGSIQDNWWRARGHRLEPDDIRPVLNAGPAKIFVGTGANGLMRLSERLTAACEKQGILLVACPTDEAVKQYNAAVRAGLAVAACLHVGC